MTLSSLGSTSEGAKDAFSDVSQAIDKGANLRECCRRLGAICELLDLIGWSDEDEPAVDVDVTGEHGGGARRADDANADKSGQRPRRRRSVQGHRRAELRLTRRLLVEAGGAVDGGEG